MRSSLWFCTPYVEGLCIQRVCPLRIGSHHPLPRKRVCFLTQRGEEQRALSGDGGGETQFGRLVRKPGTPYTLRHHVFQISSFFDSVGTRGGGLLKFTYFSHAETSLNSFLFTNIYSNTLVHSSPHLPVYCMGRWVRLHCFVSNGNIKYDTTFYAWDIGRQFTLFLHRTVKEMFGRRSMKQIIL